MPLPPGAPPTPLALGPSPPLEFGITSTLHGGHHTSVLTGMQKGPSPTEGHLVTLLLVVPRVVHTHGTDGTTGPGPSLCTIPSKGHSPQGKDALYLPHPAGGPLDAVASEPWTGGQSNCRIGFLKFYLS